MVLEKRNFTVIINLKKYGSYSASSPSLAAKKVKNKNGEFYLKETTKGSKKKVYGPYLSKKMIVQNGGDPRKDICIRVLTLFMDGSNESKRFDDNKHLFEKAFTVLKMNGFYSKRYEILSNLINYRSSIKDPRISDLICGGGITLTEAEITNEARFYNNEEYKELIGPKLTKENWIKFINYLKRQIRDIEVRQTVCSEILNVLENCNCRHSSKNSILLNKLYISLGINEKEDKCDRLTKILRLRDHYVEDNSIFDVLFADVENFNYEDNFISKNTVLIGQYLGFFLNIEELKPEQQAQDIKLNSIKIKKRWKLFLTELRKIRVIWEIEYCESINRQNSTSAGPAVNLRPRPDNSTSAGPAVANNNEWEFFNPLKKPPHWLEDNGPAVKLQQSGETEADKNNNQSWKAAKKTPNWLKEEDSGVFLASILSNKEHQEMMSHVRAHSGLSTAVRPAAINRRPIQPFEVLSTTPPNKQPNTRTLEERLAALLNN